MLMEASTVSEPIYSNSEGWFRYNYEENRLEFLKRQHKDCCVDMEYSGRSVGDVAFSKGVL